MAAIYQADVWCDDCADIIKDRIWCESEDGPTYPNRAAWEEAVGYDDDRNYDSDEYPKDCDDDEESDCPEHCAGGADCVNAEELSNGSNVGYCFGNSLTSEGAEYVVNAVCEDRLAGYTDSVACELWADVYSYLDYSGAEQCAECGAWVEEGDLADDAVCEDCIYG